MNDNRVTPEQIAALRSRVTIVFANPEGTTSTFAHAFLDGSFYLATGHSACVDPANFNAELGQQYAAKSLEAKIIAKLWECEGYSLYQRLRGNGPLIEQLAEMNELAVDQTAIEVPDALTSYLCHKTVQAMRIERIESGTEEGQNDWVLFGKDADGDVAIHAPHAWRVRFKPEVGGYVVRYEDGYVSYSPAKAFEAGYTVLGNEPAPAPIVVTDEHVNRFLACPLPDGVSPDVVKGNPHQTGTNLLSWHEAKAMLKHVFEHQSAQAGAVDPNTTTQAHIDPPAPATGEGA